MDNKEVHEGRPEPKSNRTGKKAAYAIPAVILILMLAGVLAFLLRYGPSFGIYLRRPSPQAYVKAALSFMENGYYSSTEEWMQAKAEALEELSEVISYEDTWPILRRALSAAGGKHSRLITPADMEEERQEAITLPLVSIDSMEKGIVTVVLPEFTKGPAEAQEYAHIVISWLKEHQDATGVIVDLRGNRGGDIAPMIAALSPLLPDGEVLGVMYASGQVQRMTLKDGAFTGSSSIKVGSFKMPQALPVAILTDEGTASSGEAVLLAFRGLENVQSFGASTAGYASTNTVFMLYDGTEIVLTIGADISPRTGEIFCEDPIVPDVPSECPEQDATAWIQSLR